MVSIETPDETAAMKQEQIQAWLKYFANAKMVHVSAIRAFDQVNEARKYCECMRVGLFAEITDLQIWRALAAARASGETAI